MKWAQKLSNREEGAFDGGKAGTILLGVSSFIFHKVGLDAFYAAH